MYNGYGYTGDNNSLINLILNNMEKAEISVKGMHCDSCRMLVKMELEEHLDDNQISDVDLVGDYSGVVTLNNVTPEQLAQAKASINMMDGYEVVEE